jgi:hypothetical protein
LAVPAFGPRSYTYCTMLLLALSITSCKPRLNVGLMKAANLPYAP